MVATLCSILHNASSSPVLDFGIAPEPSEKGWRQCYPQGQHSKRLIALGISRHRDINTSRLNPGSHCATLESRRPQRTSPSTNDGAQIIAKLPPPSSRMQQMVVTESADQLRGPYISGACPLSARPTPFAPSAHEGSPIASSIRSKRQCFRLSKAFSRGAWSTCKLIRHIM